MGWGTARSSPALEGWHWDKSWPARLRTLTARGSRRWSAGMRRLGIAVQPDPVAHGTITVLTEPRRAVRRDPWPAPARPESTACSRRLGGHAPLAGGDKRRPPLPAGRRRWVANDLNALEILLEELDHELDIRREQVGMG